MEQRQVPIRPRSRGAARAPEAADAQAAPGDLVDEIDGLLDEIDAVLEEQAVLVNYRQKPGQ